MAMMIFYDITRLKTNPDAYLRRCIGTLFHASNKVATLVCRSASKEFFTLLFKIKLKLQSSIKIRSQRAQEANAERKT
jgi:hypothetical protein